MTSDTIAAVSTANVLAAIGIIRISGPRALTVADRVFRPINGKSMEEIPDRLLVLGSLHSASGALLDQCLCTVSRGPNSYTGEDTAELQCHGSPLVLREGLEALFAAGARQARAGEFTQRAFLNGRMDLTQAEAVIDLISAETAEAARNAASQVGGSLHRRTDGIYQSLVAIASHYHAVLDYPDEDIEPFEMRDYRDALTAAQGELSRLVESFGRGRILRSGIKTAIVGAPNAGKSSLLNALLGYERAIVTDIPGTTRDTLEEKARIGGVLLRLTDTAGLRQTGDPVEQIGVRRALSAAADSPLVLAVFDGSRPLGEEDGEAIRSAQGALFSIAVVNKCDLPQKIDMGAIEAAFGKVCVVSALDKTGLETLGEVVSALFPTAEGTVDGEIITNARQADAVVRALGAVETALEAMARGHTPDAVLSELEAAMEALGELSGRTLREDVTHAIFSRFCVGK